MSTVKVMYVDDEEDIRQVAEMSLQLDPELDVRTCASGAEALKEARAWRPDLILLDVMMPGMDGPETLTRLRREVTEVSAPVVFVTARTQAYEVDRYVSLGAAGVIAKPFDPMTLAEQAKAHISS
ncbi:response regulator [Pikeienuella piscinae]|uniref:Response regulator n=1 Tax=Pikeienuella piscinae TaxID=2748098 RepID=A0A7L5C1K7_9RHOB|nr:response regulator [Pikeienuella piscinae]QIE56697.1 response regulator [Pikeienuella piscinae]